MKENIFEVPGLLKEIEADREEIRKTFSEISKSERIILAGSGSSYHVAKYGVMLLEENGFHAIPKTSAGFERMKVKSSDAVILISVSGTKGDALKIYNKARAAGSGLWVITSNPKVEAEHVYVVPTGMKKSYINTHSYIGQLAVFYYLFKDENLSRDAEMALKQEDEIKAISKLLSKSKNIVFLSGSHGMVVAKQSAHKLREVINDIKHVEAQAYDELLHAALPSLSNKGTVFINLEYNSGLAQRRESVKQILDGLGCERVDFALDVKGHKAPIILQIMPYLLIENMAVALGLNPDEPERINIIKDLVYNKANKSEKISPNLGG